MTTPERLNALIESHGIRKKTLCEACGIPPSTLSTWLANNPTSIPSEYIMPICHLFGVLPEALLCDDDDEGYPLVSDVGRLDIEEKMLLDNFRACDIEGKRIITASAIQEKRRSETK